MLPKRWFGIFSVLLITAVSVSDLQGAASIQSYLNDAATRAAAVTDPVQKREILDHEYARLSAGLQLLRESPVVSQRDRDGLTRIVGMLQDKRDELAGQNGYARVADSRLDGFARYVVQDMEQADVYITISAITLLLILILFVLIVK